MKKALNRLDTPIVGTILSVAGVYVAYKILGRMSAQYPAIQEFLTGVHDDVIRRVESSRMKINQQPESLEFG